MAAPIAPSKPSILFLFDFLSPYAYLASTQIHALAARHGRDVELVPVVFGALLDAHGTRGPAEIPARRRYLIRDVVRIAHRFGVPIAPPPAHPFNPLLALRVASLPMASERRRALVDALYRAAWVDGRDLGDRAVVAAVVAAAGGEPGLVDAAGTDEAKARLRRQTDEAIAAGVFGVPTMLVDGEPFWGCDSLPYLEGFLAGERPVHDELVARWEKLPAAVQRRAVRPGGGSPA